MGIPVVEETLPPSATGAEREDDGRRAVEGTGGRARGEVEGGVTMETGAVETVGRAKGFVVEVWRGAPRGSSSRMEGRREPAIVRSHRDYREEGIRQPCAVLRVQFLTNDLRNDGAGQRWVRKVRTQEQHVASSYVRCPSEQVLLTEHPLWDLL